MKQLMVVIMAVLSVVGLYGQAVKRFDVVIHEIFPDPTPQVGLPNSEFIELRNISGAPVNLRNWKLSDGSSTATISINYALQADSCVVICPSSAVSAFAQLGAAIGVSGFPSLNNDADVIWLMSPDGRTVHAVAYETSWYRNAVKSDGGWSLEMIDVANPCGGSANWMASVGALGGTPGKRNSVEGHVVDDQAPALLRTYTIDSVTIVAVFDESLDSASAAVGAHYKLSNNIMSARASPPMYKEVKLTVQRALARDSVYTLTASDVMDCTGNSIGVLSTASVGLPAKAAAGDIVINEVLFNPTPVGTDYVELYNKSNKIVDAASLYLGNNKLSQTPFLIFPGEYIVATENAAMVSSQYAVKQPVNILVIAQMPSMPDDKGNIVLLNTEGMVIDELSYEEKWHFPLIVNREGVALERIDVRQPTQQKDNWTSAASDAGYGTPTYRNSQYNSGNALQGSIEILPKVFSPGNDGRDDWCLVRYNLSTANSVATITVFDISGNVVRNLCNNITLSSEGFVRWDGLDNKGNPLATGVYVVLTELFNVQGKRKIFKNPVTITHSF